MIARLAPSAEQRISAPPDAVFALFGAASGAGWLFDALRDRVAVGSVVTLGSCACSWASDRRTSCARPPPR